MAETQSKTEKKSEKDDEVKCDNHPEEKAQTFTADGSIAPIHLCDYCVPKAWRDDKS